MSAKNPNLPYHLKVISHRQYDGVTTTRVAVSDRYHSKRHRLDRMLVRAFTGTLQWYLERRPDLQYGDRANIARMLTYIPSGIRAWAAYMPGGFATHPVHDPDYGKLADGKRLDFITRRFFRHTYDAVGLRSRAYIMSWWVRSEILATDRPIKWLSLASGSGQPLYDVLKTFPRSRLQSAEILCTDMDASVLDFATQLAARQHMPDCIKWQLMDATSAEELSQTMQRLQPWIVDAMGLVEYLSDEAVVRLVQTIYRELPTGGMFVFTNMSPRHPHLDVHQRSLGWPGVIVRKHKQITALLRAAGIDDRQIEIAKAEDGVYNVVKITKGFAE